MSCPAAKLPQELFRLIVDEVKSHSDLYHLSLVSHGINYWAQPALYRIIDFESINYKGWGIIPLNEKALSAALQIAAYPHLGLYVHHVSILNQAPPTPFPWSQFFQALRNLKSLAIYFFNDLMLCAIGPNVPYQLRSLICRRGPIEVELGRPVGQQLVEFFNVQADLEHVELWFIAISLSGTRLSPQALPKLNTLLAGQPDIQATLPGRNLKRLSDAIDQWNTSNHLIMGASSIYSLCVRSMESLASYRQCFSVLTRLEVFMHTRFQCRNIPSCLEDLHVLKKLCIHVLESSWEPNEDDDWNSGLVPQSFLACPSLEKIEIRNDSGWQLEPPSLTWLRNIEVPLETSWDSQEWRT